MPLPRFTAIGLADHIARVDDRLRDAFGLQLHIPAPEPAVIAEVLLQMNPRVIAEAALEIARRSRNDLTAAKHLLRRASQPLRLLAWANVREPCSGLEPHISVAFFHWETDRKPALSSASVGYNASRNATRSVAR